MASKILATVLAVAVLSVGGYTYWHYADGGPCCGTQVKSPEASTGCLTADATMPCCQEPSRTSCITLGPGESCCDDTPAAASPEVLTIAPREVK